MKNLIIIIFLIFIIGLAVFYIVKSKKNGKKCIGCPYADSCTKNCNCQNKEQ